MCEPICERECVYGKCTAPNICTCDDGYEPDTHDLFACKPTCKNGCLYGECIAPNVCICNKGYSLNTSSVCEPICSETCVMGTCVAPESCSCFVGYGLFENSKYICEPVCEKACLNGRCTAPGICMCNEGFQLSGDESEEHICKPYCETSCEPFGVCTAPNICSCFEGYRLANKMQIEKIVSIKLARLYYGNPRSISMIWQMNLYLFYIIIIILNNYIKSLSKLNISIVLLFQEYVNSSYINSLDLYERLVFRICYILRAVRFASRSAR